MQDYKDLVAAFEARGGEVQKVDEGKGLGLTDKDWGYLRRGEVPKRMTLEDAAPFHKGAREALERQYDDDEGAHERYREAVNDAYMSGGSAARDEVMQQGVHSFRRGR